MKKVEKVFIFLEMIFYLLGSIELLIYSQGNLTIMSYCILFIVLNTLFRQLYLYGKEKYVRYSFISIIIQIIVVSYMLILSNSGVVTLFYCTIIFEVVFIYSVYVSITITIASAVFMFIWYSTVISTDNVIYLILSGFYSFGLALLLVFVLGYLIKVQSREKAKVLRVNQELEEAYQKLLEKSSENQELSVEKERMRMAREIHDTLAHTLTAVVVQMEACKKLLMVDSDRVLIEIDKAQKYTREGLNDVKRTIKALRPQILEDRTFIDAILNLTEDIEQNFKIEFILNINDKLYIPSIMEVPLFRVIQETVTNSIRHGEANQIHIDIFEVDEHLHINIKDDGIGCNLIKEGFGLKGIYERIRALNGTVDFFSALKDGFQSRIRVPLKGGMQVEN